MLEMSYNQIIYWVEIKIEIIILMNYIDYK